MTEELLDQWVVVKVKRPSNFPNQPSKYFYYNGKLVRNTEAEIVVDDVLLDLQVFPKTTVESIRKCNNADMMHIADLLNQRKAGYIIRKLDEKLVAKVENLKKEFGELKKHLKPKGDEP